jgi:hypothetical protein
MLKRRRSNSINQSEITRETVRVKGNPPRMKMSPTVIDFIRPANFTTKFFLGQIGSKQVKSIYPNATEENRYMQSILNNQTDNNIEDMAYKLLIAKANYEMTERKLMGGVGINALERESLEAAKWDLYEEIFEYEHTLENQYKVKRILLQPEKPIKFNFNGSQSFLRMSKYEEVVKDGGKVIFGYPYRALQKVSGRDIVMKLPEEDRNLGVDLIGTERGHSAGFYERGFNKAPSNILNTLLITLKQPKSKAVEETKEAGGNEMSEDSDNEESGYGQWELESKLSDYRRGLQEGKLNTHYMRESRVILRKYGLL